MSRHVTVNTFVVAASTRRLFTPAALHRLANTSQFTEAHKLRPRFFSTTPLSKFTQTTSNMTVHVVADAKEFNSQVVEGSNGGKLVVVDFFATWCGPCKAISPVLTEWSNDAAYEKVGFYKVDVDKASDVAAEHTVRAMPTFMLFKDGEKVETVVGANPNALKKAIDDHM